MDHNHYVQPADRGRVSESSQNPLIRRCACSEIARLSGRDGRTGEESHP